MGSVSKYTVQPNGYDDRFQFWRSSDYNPKGNLWHCSHMYSNHAHTFGWCKYTYFAQKNTNMRVNCCYRNTTPTLEPTNFVSPDTRWYHSTTRVLTIWQVIRIFDMYTGDSLIVIIDQILRKLFFSKIVPVFRKYLSVSQWNLSGYFSVSFRFPQVTEFGKSTAIYLADLFCQLYSALWSSWQEDPNDPQERCAMARTSCAKL